MVTPVFATLIFDDITGLLKSIRCLNRATMSFVPDEPQKNYTASDEPFRYTGSSTGRLAVCIINDKDSQNQISGCLSNRLL
jgi:hypothetical protein